MKNRPALILFVQLCWNSKIPDLFIYSVQIVLHHLFKSPDSAPVIQDDISKDVTDGVTQQTSNGKEWKCKISNLYGTAMARLVLVMKQ